MAGPSLRSALVIALDAAIAIYLVALVVFVATGGVDLGWVSVRAAAKPFLVLWVLVPIRLALHLAPAPALTLEPIVAALHHAAQRTAARVPASLVDVGFAFAATRLAAMSIGFLVNILYPVDRIRPFALPFENAKFAETFAAWDSGWYFDIAVRGYYYTPDGQSSTAFFPLYPLLMRALAWPFGSSDTAVWTAGMVISSLAFVAALLVLHDLTERVCGEREIARRAVLYVCVFPFSFFLTRVYPAGLFLLLTVLAVSCAYRSRWGLSGLLGGLAALARPQGILIVLPLALMAMRQARGRDLAMRAVQLSPIPIAFIAFNVYIGSLSGMVGQPFAWLASESQWGYTLGHPPWEQLLGLLSRIERHGLYDYFFTSEVAAYHLFHGVVALFLLAATPLVFTRLGTPLGAYVLASLLVPLSGSGLEGIGRYSAVLFPVFMVLATVKSPRFHEVLLIVWSLFLALFVGLFATWRPIY